MSDKSGDKKSKQQDRREFLVKAGKASAGGAALTVYLSAGALSPALAGAPNPMPRPTPPFPSPMPSVSNLPEPTTIALTGAAAGAAILYKKGGIAKLRATYHRYLKSRAK